MSNVFHLLQRNLVYCTVLYCTVLYCTLIINQAAFGQDRLSCTPISSGYCSSFSIVVEQIPDNQTDCGGFTDCSNVSYGVRLSSGSVSNSQNLCLTNLQIMGSILSNGNYSIINETYSNQNCTFPNNALLSIENEVEYAFELNFSGPTQVPLNSSGYLFVITVDVGIGETVSFNIATATVTYDDGLLSFTPCIYTQGAPNNTIFVDVMPAPYIAADVLQDCGSGKISFDTDASLFQNLNNTNAVIPVRFDGGSTGQNAELDIYFEIVSDNPIATPQVDFATLVNQTNNTYTYVARLRSFYSGFLGNITLFEPMNVSQGAEVTIKFLNARFQEVQKTGDCCAPRTDDPFTVTFDGEDICNPNIIMTVQGNANTNAPNLGPCQTRSLITFEGPTNFIDFTFICFEVQYETTGDLQINAVNNGLAGGLNWVNPPNSSYVACGFPNNLEVSSFNSATNTAKFCFGVQNPGTFATVLSNTGIEVVFEGTSGCIVNATVIKSEIILAGPGNTLCAMSSQVDVADLQASCVPQLFGEVVQENGNMAPNVKLDFIDPFCPVNPITLNSNQCSETSYGLCVCKGGNFEITPTYQGNNYLNGVTTFDILLISRHILGIQSLDSPYKIIAADANGINGVTTTDLVAIRKLILLAEPSFNANSWRYVPQDFVFVNPQNPFISSFPESIMNAQIGVPNDFVAIKVGDVNGTANCAVGRSGERPTKSTTTYRLIQLDKGVWQLDFFQESAVPLVAFQGALRLKNGTIMSYSTAESDQVDEQSLAQKDTSTLRIAWAQTDGYSTIGKGEKMFIMIVKSDETPEFDWDVNDDLASLAYLENGEEVDLVLETTSEKVATATYLGLDVQVFPNPIQKGDPLQMKLKSSFDGPVRIIIQNSTGAFQRSASLELQKDKEAIQNFNLQGTSDEVLFYQVISTKGNATGTILLK